MRLAAALLALLLPTLAWAGNALTFDGSGDYFTATASAGYDADDFAFVCLADPASTSSVVYTMIAATDSSTATTTIAEIRTVVIAGNRAVTYNHEDRVSGTGDPTNSVSDPADWIYASMMNDDVSSRSLRFSVWTQAAPDTLGTGTNSTTLDVFGTADTVSVGRAATSTPYGYFSGDISWCAAWSEGLDGSDGPIALPVGYAIQQGMNPAMAGIEKFTSFWMFWEAGTTIQDLGPDGMDMTKSGTPSVSDSMPKPMFWARGAR